MRFNFFISILAFFIALLVFLAPNSVFAQSPGSKLCVDLKSETCSDQLIYPTPKDASCGENEKKVVFEFNQSFRNHFSALSKLQNTITTQAKKTCSSLGAGNGGRFLVSRIVESKHEIGARFLICPAVACYVDPSTGEPKCPPCPVTSFTLTGEGTVCCKPYGVKAVQPRSTNTARQ